MNIAHVWMNKLIASRSEYKCERASTWHVWRSTLCVRVNEYTVCKGTWTYLFCVGVNEHTVSANTAGVYEQTELTTYNTRTHFPIILKCTTQHAEFHFKQQQNIGHTWSLCRTGPLDHSVVCEWIQAGLGFCKFLLPRPLSLPCFILLYPPPQPPFPYFSG